MSARLPYLALGLALAAALLLLAAGPGSRFDLWGFRTGFSLMRWAAYLGLAAVALGVAGLVLHRSGVGPAVAALLIGGGAALIPLHWSRQGRNVPPIHDISTDTERPPSFVAILPLRADAANPAAYGGAEVAAAQRTAYPDIAPLSVAMDPRAAFQRAETVARDMGWAIVAAEPDEGRIEATATTPWFGFKDDVVVRIEGEGGGSRVDVRSVSRVGRSDMGTNAARIRKFLARLRT